MKIDGFIGLEEESIPRRIERLLDTQTRRPSSEVKETIEVSLRMESHEQFVKLYNYLKGRTYVYVYDWRYDDGFYAVRNQQYVQKATYMELRFSLDYEGKELSEELISSAMQLKYETIVAEDFSDSTTWPVAALSLPKTSSGVGNQYEDVTWDHRGTNTFAIDTVVPDTGEVSSSALHGNTSDTHVVINDINEWGNYEVRAILATDSTSEAIGLYFHILDDQVDTIDPTCGLYVLPYQDEFRLYELNGGSPSLVKSIPLKSTIPIVASTEPVAGEWIDVMIRCYGPVMEFYHNGQFLDHYKVDAFPSGTVGIHFKVANGWVDEFYLKRIVVPVQPTTRGAYNVSEFIHDSTYTQDGWVQRCITPYQPVEYFVKSNKGLVRVWDMKDGDWKTPHRWEQITESEHSFKGDIFIENGLAGLLYSEGSLYYVYNEVLKDVVTGYDVSAWWSQGYSLRSLGLKAFLSPSATAGSLWKQYQWRDPFWFLKARDKWEESRTYEPLLHLTSPSYANNYLVVPDLEAVFYMQSWLPDVTYDTGSRLVSYNETAVREGISLSCPNKKLMGAVAESSSVETTIEGLTTLASSQVYKGRYINSAEGQILRLNGQLDNYEPTPANHGVYESSGATLIPLREETGTLDPTVGGISKMILRDRRSGVQTYRGLDSGDLIAWYSFDRTDFDRTSGTYGQHQDKSGNDNHLSLSSGLDLPGLLIPGVVNQALYLSEGTFSPEWTNTSVTGHTSGNEVTISFWMRKPTDSVSSNKYVLQLKNAIGTDRVSVELRTDDTLQIIYAGATHASIDMTTDIYDNNWHLITIDDTYVYVDDVQYGGTARNITDQITQIKIGPGAVLSKTVNEVVVIDELVIIDHGSSSSLSAYMPSLSDIPIKRTKHLKAEFDSTTNSRWSDWIPNDLILYSIFDEGVEDISARQHAITVEHSNGYYKQDGFLVAEEDAFSITLNNDIDISNGLTLMWKGCLVNTEKIINFDNVTIVADAGFLQVNIDNRLIETIGVDQNYHEFWLRYDNLNHSRGLDGTLTVWIDGEVKSRDMKYTRRANVAVGLASGSGETKRCARVHVPSRLESGKQYFGGSIISDVVFLKGAVSIYKIGWLDQEEIYWKKYYKVTTNGNELSDPSIISAGRTSAEIGFGGRFVGRLEAGNPLILFSDRWRKYGNIEVTDEEGEWHIVAGKGCLRDRTYGDHQTFGDHITNRYLYAIHSRTANGFGVFSGLDSKPHDSETRRAVVTVNAKSTTTTADPITFRTVNDLILGFFNWPMRWYFKEASQGTDSGTSSITETTDYFHDIYVVNAADEYQIEFPSTTFGSYLAVIKAHTANTFNIEIGDPDWDDNFMHNTTGHDRPMVVPVNYMYYDTANEGTDINIHLTAVTGALTVDYTALLPLSNGLHFPLDYIAQLAARNG